MSCPTANQAKGKDMNETQAKAIKEYRELIARVRAEVLAAEIAKYEARRAAR
jgi:hypothetical protein